VILRTGASHRPVLTEPANGSSENTLVLQSYVPDTGEVTKDRSRPVRLAGRHWGALRVGVEPSALLEG
jgi:methyl-accepting chemotaxis protein